MKKIIGGKKYDTDTAQLVADDDNRFDCNALGYVHEWLYRKRTGEYFICGEGGPQSKYAEPCKQAGWARNGSAIVPLTDDEAREWGEEHMDVDAYEAEFGEVEE